MNAIMMEETEALVDDHRQPLVSVILPTYNGRAFVQRAVCSVLAQTYPSLELVVVDDGSHDGTADVVEHTFDDPRLTLTRLAENRGPYVARNAGVAASRGDLIAFIDADDEWRDDKLQKQVGQLLAGAFDMVHSRVVDVFPDGTRMHRTLHPRASEWRENLWRDLVATSTVLMRRSTFERLGGFDEAFRAMGDWDLWVRVMREGTAAHTGEALAVTYLGADSIQRGPVDVFEAFYRLALDKRLPELQAAGMVRRAEAQRHYAVAAKLWGTGQAATARRRLLRSLRIRPSLAATLLLVLTLLPRAEAQRLRFRLRRARAWISR
jgi:glycosyltransferase involved in cell wall biosynthesis